MKYKREKGENRINIEKRNRFKKAYLDIETSFEGKITVVGIYCPGSGFFQFYGEKITSEAILQALKSTGTNIIVTYNGKRFDLKVLQKELGLKLLERFGSIDLMYECWRYKLFGGLKAVERALGIEREEDEVDGREAMKLWKRFSNEGDKEALDRLLKYNREDVMNLIRLEEGLRKMSKEASNNKALGKGVSGNKAVRNKTSGKEASTTTGSQLDLRLPI